MESETESVNGDTIHNLVNLPVEFTRRRSSTRENYKNTMPGVEYRRRSSTRDYPIIPGSILEDMRRQSSQRDNLVGFPGGAEFTRQRNSAIDNPEIPGSVEYPRRRSSIREGSLLTPGFTESQRRRSSIRPDTTPGQFLSRRASLMPVASLDTNVRSRKTNQVALPTIPNPRMRRGSVQIQNFTKPRFSSTAALKSMRRGSRNKKEKVFQVSCYLCFKKSREEYGWSAL